MTDRKTGIHLPLWAIIVDGIGSLITVVGFYCYLTDTALLPELGNNNLTLGIAFFGLLLMGLGMADLLNTLMKRQR
jgi:hypothetical protein